MWQFILVWTDFNGLHLWAKYVYMPDSNSELLPIIAVIFPYTDIHYKIMVDISNLWNNMVN